MARSFESEVEISWYRSPIEREVLRELMKRSDLRGWIQTLFHLGFFFVTAGLAYVAFLNIDASNWHWSLPLLLVVLFVHGTMGPFMGLVAIHELQHRTVFKTRWLNHLFEKIYAFISWSDYIWYQQSHPIHHIAACHVSYDGEVLLPLKFSLSGYDAWSELFAWNPKATWVRLQVVWRHANGKILGDWYNHVLPESDKKLRRKHRNWARTLIVGHALLALTFTLTGHWFLIVVFTFGTFYCRWLGFLCGVAQHYGLKSDISDFRFNSRTFTCSWLTSFYYWNMQYHVEHHMYSAVPFYNLPKLREVLKHDLPPAPHGLYATWKEMMDIRRKSLADSTYQFVPAVPVAVAARPT